MHIRESWSSLRLLLRPLPLVELPDRKVVWLTVDCGGNVRREEGGLNGRECGLCSN